MPPFSLPNLWFLSIYFSVSLLFCLPACLSTRPPLLSVCVYPGQCLTQRTSIYTPCILEMTFLMIQTLRASPCQAPPRPTRGSTASPVRAPECARPPASAPARPCGRVLCRTDAMRYPPVAPRMPRGPWRRRPISWASSGTSSTLTAPCARARLSATTGVPPLGSQV